MKKQLLVAAMFLLLVLMSPLLLPYILSGAHIGVLKNLKSDLGIVFGDMDYLAFVGAVFGSIIAGVFTMIGVIYTLNSQRQERLEGERSLINLQGHVDDYDLKKITAFQSGRVLKNIRYENMLKNFPLEDNDERLVLYLSVGQVGFQDFIKNCSIDLELKIRDREDESYHLYLPFIQKSEAILTPVCFAEQFAKDDVLVRKISIDYTTASGENLLYNVTFMNESDSRAIERTYVIEKGGHMKLLFEAPYRITESYGIGTG